MQSSFLVPPRRTITYATGTVYFVIARLAKPAVAIQLLDSARGPDPSTLLRVILSLSMDELVERLDCFVALLASRAPRNDQ